MRTRPGWAYVAATLIIAGFVAGAAIAQAIGEHSWQPVWSIAWLPAVLVVPFLRPRSERRCLPRVRRGRRS